MLRVGIIGSGSIARNAHVPGYRAQKDTELTAVCDVVPGRAATFA